MKPSEQHKLDLIQTGVRPRTAAKQVAQVGDTITISKGREVIQPFSFNVFEVGPIALTVQLQAGETFEQAYIRASATLEELYEAEFQIRFQSFKEHVMQARGGKG